MFGLEGFFYVYCVCIVELVLCCKVLIIFDVCDYVEVGGFVSYGLDYFNVMELFGEYIVCVFRGVWLVELLV